MVALKLTISVAELGERMRARLRAPGAPETARVLWQQGGQHVLLHLDSLRVRGVDGWLLCNLDLETPVTNRARLQFIYFLGTDGEADGLRAAATISAARMPAAQLAERWGADVQRVLWDAVLDGIEAALHHVRRQMPGEPLTLAGFTCVNEQLQIAVLAGAA